MKKYTALLLTFLLLSTMMPPASMQAMSGKGAEGSSKKSDKDKDNRDRDRFRRDEDRARDRDEPIKEPYGLRRGVQDPIHVSKPTEGVPDDSGPSTSRQERVREYADTEVTRHVQEIARLEERMRLALQHGKFSEWEKDKANLLRERKELRSHLDQLKRFSASGEDVERLIIENNARITELEVRAEPSITVPADKKGKQLAKPGIRLPHSLKKFKEGVSRLFKPVKDVEEVSLPNVTLEPAEQMLEATEVVLENQYDEIENRLADRYGIFLEDSEKYGGELDEIENLQQKLSVVGLEDEPAKYFVEINKQIDEMDRRVGDLSAIRSNFQKHDPKPGSARAYVRRLNNLRRRAKQKEMMDTPLQLKDLDLGSFTLPEKGKEFSLREVLFYFYDMLHVLVKKEKEGQVFSNEDKDFLQSMDQKLSAYERALYEREFADVDQVASPNPHVDVTASQTMIPYLRELLLDRYGKKEESLASPSHKQAWDDVKDFIAKASGALGIPMSPEFTRALHESPFDSLRMIEKLLHLLKQKPDLQAGMKKEIRRLRYALREWLGIAAGEEWEGGRISDFPRAVKALSDTRVRDWISRTKGEGMYYREGDKRVGLKYLEKVFGGLDGTGGLNRDEEVSGNFVVPERSEVLVRNGTDGPRVINPYTAGDVQRIQRHDQAVNQPLAGIPNTRYYIGGRITDPRAEKLSDGARVFMADEDRWSYLLESDKKGLYITRWDGKKSIRIHKNKNGRYFGRKKGRLMEFVLDKKSGDNRQYAFPADSVATVRVEAGVQTIVNRKGKTVNLCNIYPVWLSEKLYPLLQYGRLISLWENIHAFVLPYDSVPGSLSEDEKGIYFKQLDRGRVDVLAEELNHFVEDPVHGKVYLEKFSIGSKQFIAEPGLTYSILTRGGEKYIDFRGNLYPIEMGGKDISVALPKLAIGLPETSKYIKNERGEKRPVWFITTEQGDEEALVLFNFYSDTDKRKSPLPHHIPYLVKTNPGDPVPYVNSSSKEPEEHVYIWSLKNN